MRRIILTVLILTISQLLATGQPLKYKEAQNTDLKYVLNNISKTTSFNDDKNYLYINVFIVGDPSGSAHNESCEITHSIYIAVSGDGEAPEQHLFRLSSLYDPKITTWVKMATGPALIITYGPFNKRKKATILVGLKRLTIK